MLRTRTRLAVVVALAVLLIAGAWLVREELQRAQDTAPSIDEILAAANAEAGDVPQNQARQNQAQQHQVLWTPDTGDATANTLANGMDQAVVGIATPEGPILRPSLTAKTPVMREPITPGGGFPANIPLDDPQAQAQAEEEAREYQLEQLASRPPRAVEQASPGPVITMPGISFGFALDTADFPEGHATLTNFSGADYEMQITTGAEGATVNGKSVQQGEWVPVIGEETNLEFNSLTRITVRPLQERRVPQPDGDG